MFAVAVWMRLRSLQVEEELAPATASVAGATASAEGTLENAATESEEAYTLVPTDSNGKPETIAQRRTREERYNELLRSAPPAASPRAATAAAEPPTLFDRIVTPVANALGINRAKPQIAQPPTPRPPQPQSQASRAPNDSPSSRTTTSEEPRGPQAEDDPETDTVPPQLLTAQFTPAEIADGETTMFAAFVNDNLSGVRSVSGVITSPSGSLQGFSCTREGETNRFVANISIPKEAPEGTWSVKYLTLTDNASNNVSLNQSQGTLPGSATFRVASSAPDSSGPQLKAVWLDRQAMRAGEKNTLFIQAEDDKSGVSLVSGVFVSPQKAARIGFGCRPGANATWECSVMPPSCLDCGAWALEQVQLQDKANNMTTFRGESNQVVRAVSLNISAEICDGIPPQVVMLTLTPTVVSNAQVSVITVNAQMVDEGGCGASTLSAQAIPPGGVGGARRPVTFMPSTDGQTFIGRLEIPQFAAKGQWSIAWVQALDKGLNLRAYSTSDPVVAKATFRVE
ncbi:MAG TPA: hypothetical protein VEK79_08630 [Thermoanaerobaculia bacterium]|nr:hypothetical protein [Thermoanaerobaculia bacterium]